MYILFSVLLFPFNIILLNSFNFKIQFSFNKFHSISTFYPIIYLTSMLCCTKRFLLLLFGYFFKKKKNLLYILLFFPPLMIFLKQIFQEGRKSQAKNQKCCCELDMCDQIILTKNNRGKKLFSCVILLEETGSLSEESRMRFSVSALCAIHVIGRI